jgi:hypothetical protein
VGVGKVKDPDIGAILHIAVNASGRVMEETGHLAKVINATNRCGGRSWDINVLKPEVTCKNLGRHARCSRKRSHSKCKYG